ncbi:hypothetical protein [Myxococcus landrumensis]|uniref:Uncharacterized protein n=1 Tax=Myxococcus landrumensis TaxID=2813577 RepID=A0ABX7N3C0_9BACT|nr:hypothetical protein [Myxococcus landrumus]QSQ13211.1 hypothetical protein JY572_33485 [Myxococcus landrumus]
MPILRQAFALQALHELGRLAPDLARVRAQRSLDASLQRLREACLTTLGMELDTLTLFDARSVVRLFAHAEQARILAHLMDERARTLAEHGDYVGALSDTVYAGQLLACSRQRFGVQRDAGAAEALERELPKPGP